MKLTRRDFIKSIAAFMAGFVWSGVRVEAEYDVGGELFGLPIVEIESDKKWGGEIVLGEEVTIWLGSRTFNCDAYLCEPILSEDIQEQINKLAKG